LQAVYGGEEEKENCNCEQDYYATSMQKGAVEHDLLLNEYRGKVIAMGVEMKEFSLGGKSRFACGVAGLASATGLAGGAGCKFCLRLPELKFCCTSHPKSVPSPDLSEIPGVFPGE
jgi:hypothetical protein